MGETTSTDDELVELWLSGRPVTTCRAYRRDVGSFRSFIGKPLGEVGFEELARFLANLGGAPATRARTLAAVKSLLGFAWRTGYLADNPGRLIRTPRIDDTLGQRLLDDEDVAAVVGETSPGRDRTLVQLLYRSGIRISEAVRLRWSDIGRTWIVVKGKGNKTRTVVLPGEFIAVVLGQRPAGARDSDPVFANKYGAALSTRYARAIVARASAEALGKTISPHWLRHAHASAALSRGCPLHVLRDSLGHASIATTSRYLHARPNQGSALYVPGGP